MSEQKNVKGTVSRVSFRDGRFGLQLDNADVWYNGFGISAPVTNGDEVEFEYVENAGKTPGTVFKNVREEDIKVLSSGPKKPIEVSGQEIGLRKKLAMDCVLKAVEILSVKAETEVKPSVIETIATEWYKIGMSIPDKVHNDTEETV